MDSSAAEAQISRLRKWSDHFHRDAYEIMSGLSIHEEQEKVIYHILYEENVLDESMPSTISYKDLK